MLHYFTTLRFQIFAFQYFAEGDAHKHTHWIFLNMVLYYYKHITLPYIAVYTCVNSVFFYL